MSALWQGSVDARRIRALLYTGLVIFAVTIGFGNATASPEKQISGAGLYFVRLVIILGYLSVVVFTRLKVTITETETRTSFGWGWPTRRIKHDQVENVSVINVRPMEWGGWGYRWVPWKRGSAAVLRKGEGLEFDLKNGRHFVVTVDDANSASAILKSRVSH